MQSSSYVLNVGPKALPNCASRKAETSIIGCLTGHTRLNEHMAKLKLKPSPDCSCKTGKQTVDHILLNCPLYSADREILHDNIEYIYHKNKVPVVNRESSIRNLLVPHHDRITNREISKALEAFLTATNITI